MFALFRKKTKSCAKDPTLGRMWVCTFRFRPWCPKENVVEFKEVDIIRAESCSDGILVGSSEMDPFGGDSCLCGYVGKITLGYNWIGFFETEYEARQAFRTMMLEWIDIMKSKVDETWKAHEDSNAQKKEENA